MDIGGHASVELKILLPNIRFRQFATGKVLMHQGEVGDYGHILCQGTVEVVAQAANGSSIHISDFNAPAFFGEIALLTGETRNASIVARSDVEVLEVNREALAHLFRERPESLNEVSEVVARRISETRERRMGSAVERERLNAARKRKRIEAASAQKVGSEAERLNWIEVTLGEGDRRRQNWLLAKMKATFGV